MKKSRRLDTVLRVRKIHEDLAGQALALANMSLALANSEKNKRVEHYNSLTVDGGIKSQEEFLREQQTLKIAAESIGYSVHMITQAQLVVNQKRDYYVQARKSVKVIEKLKDRRIIEEAKADDLELGKTYDDMSGTRWISQQASLAEESSFAEYNSISERSSIAQRSLLVEQGALS